MSQICMNIVEIKYKLMEIEIRYGYWKGKYKEGQTFGLETKTD